RPGVLISRPLPPVSALLALQRVDPGRYRLLLQSVALGTAQARWDLPLLADGGSLTLGRDGDTRDASGAVVPGTFLQALDAAWRAGRLPREQPRWPFRGGWARRLCCELAGRLEPVLVLAGAP